MFTCCFVRGQRVKLRWMRYSISIDDTFHQTEISSSGWVEKGDKAKQILSRPQLNRTLLRQVCHDHQELPGRKEERTLTPRQGKCGICDIIKLAQTSLEQSAQFPCHALRHFLSTTHSTIQSERRRLLRAVFCFLVCTKMDVYYLSP